MNPAIKSYDAALVRNATYASVSVATILIFVKFFSWWMTDSVSLQATLIDSLLDAAASLINMFAVRRAQRPATEKYRFGHGKAEAIAALGQSLFIAASALWLIREAIQRLINPIPLVETNIGIVVMILAMILTYILVRYQTKVVALTGSAAIKADSLHYRSDLLINAGVILSLVGTAISGVDWLDPLAGAIIAAYILHTAWTITSEAFYILMDGELPEEIRQKVISIAIDQPDVLGVHELKTRSSGLKNFIQLHLELNGEITLSQAHIIADRVEKAILKEFPLSEVIIHEDPKNLFEPHRAKVYEADT